MKTPETVMGELEALAEWFDDPNESPAVALSFHGPVSPGYALRTLVRNLAEATRQGREEFGRE